MCTDRRNFLRVAGLTAAGALFAGEARAHDEETAYAPTANTPEAIARLRPMLAALRPFLTKSGKGASPKRRS